MQTFNFPYHTERTEYPESGSRIQLGGGYIFSSPPNGPDLRRFTLNFPVMFYYTDSNGDLDFTERPELNMGLMEEFYKEHKLYKTFIYPHPKYGDTLVQFHSALKIPEGIKGGNGALKELTIELVEIVQ